MILLHYEIKTPSIVSRHYATLIVPLWDFHNMAAFGYSMRA
jgi:hypothetical protein